MRTRICRRVSHPLLAAICLAARSRGLVVALAGMFLMPSGTGSDERGVRAFLADLSQQAAEAEQASRSVISGDDGWLFFVSELRALSVGRFWGAEATRVSRASKPEYADPLPTIVDFHEQLHKV